MHAGGGNARKVDCNFRLNAGKVVDKLQTDYECFFDLSSVQDWSVYESNIELYGPPGHLWLQGISAYKLCMSTTRLCCYAFMVEKEMKSKLSYAPKLDPYTVNVHWRAAFTQGGRAYHVDGISVYTLSDRGLVKRHVFRNLIAHGNHYVLQKPLPALLTAA